jgi:hypothetical protein
MFKQLKNRYGDLNRHRKFMVGIEKNMMRLFDCEETAQRDIIKDDAGEPIPTYSTAKKFREKNFESIRV